MATSAQFAAIPIFGSQILTTADTSLTAPTTFGTIITAGANGTRIDYIEVQGVATTTTTLINLFVFNGTTNTLWQQIPVLAMTSGTTAPAFSATISSNGNANIMPLSLPTGHTLRATTSIAQTGVRVTAYGGDF